MRKFVIVCNILILLTLNVLYAQTQAIDCTKEITNINNEISNLKIENNQLVKQNKELQEQYTSIKNILDQYISLNSGVSNYLTVLSIILTILAIGLPFLNLFTVIIPNKKIRRKIKKISKKIPDMVDQNFEKYMVGFEKKKADQAIESFVSDNNTGELFNFLFSNEYDFDEAQYKKIIDKIKTGIKIVDSGRILIISHLLDIDSKECLDFFKSVLEDQESPYLEYAVKYFTISDLQLHIKYLEKILTGRNDFENVFVLFYNEICSQYLNSKDKSIKEDQVGKEKIFLLLNNKYMVKKFNKDNLTSNLKGFKENFLLKENELIFHPFVKDTLMYKEHYLVK